MEYKVKGAKLQDLITKTESIIALAGDLGSISGANLVVPAEQFSEDLVAADFVWARNLSANEACTVTLGSGNFTFDSTTAITASSVIQLVFKLPS